MACPDVHGSSRTGQYKANHGETSLRVAAFSSGPCVGQGQSEVRLARHPCAGRASSPLPSSYLARKGSCSIASFQRACSGAPQTQQTFTIRPFLSACQRWMLWFSATPLLPRLRGAKDITKTTGLSALLYRTSLSIVPRIPRTPSSKPFLSAGRCSVQVQAKTHSRPHHAHRIASHYICRFSLPADLFSPFLFHPSQVSCARRKQDQGMRQTANMIGTPG
jgi:hypothetical protein